MIIALVSEFAQMNYFQWYKVWSVERQREKNVMLKEVIIDAVTSKYPENSSYWMWLKQADLIYVYCTRYGSFGGLVSNEQLEKWMWWKLPILAKPFMKPEAKMICQWDDEWAWLFWQGSNWFSNQPETRSPEEFFKETGILDVADENWTVMENPVWGKYSHKPVRYMPLPHLWRYGTESSKADAFALEKGIVGMHGDSVALLRHTCVYSSVQHTIKNIAEKLGMPVVNFVTRWDCHDSSFVSRKIKVENIIRTSQNAYMDILLSRCFVAIDDAENYVGWSRFVMECLLCYLPCIGSNYATKIFTPELYTAHKDYNRQIELVQKLRENPAFYEQVVRDGRARMFQHLDTDRLCNEMIRIAREDLKVKETNIDIDRELFISILEKLLPWDIPPKRPSDSQMIVDPYSRIQMSQSEWDTFYGPYEKFINDEPLFKSLIRETMDRKEKRTKR